MTTHQKHQFIVQNYNKMKIKDLAKETGYALNYVSAIIRRNGLSKYEAVRKRKKEDLQKYQRILEIAKKKGYNNTTDLLKDIGLSSWKEICRKA